MKSPETKVSKNCYKGSPITSIQEILWCAKNKLSVYHLLHRRVYPAAVIINWQCRYVADCVEQGWLFRTLKDE